MKRKSILLLIFLSVYFLFACGNKAPLKYKVNKTPELKQYESEVQEKAAFQQSLAEESMAEKARLEEEEKAKEALVWKKTKVEKERKKVRGIYITDNTAGSERMDKILDGMQGTELNAIVLDIKNDQGRISYKMKNSLVEQNGASINGIKDIPALLKRCHERGIYVIARLVCFRDPILVPSIRSG